MIDISNQQAPLVNTTLQPSNRADKVRFKLRRYFMERRIEIYNML